ncbi:MAG: hypothetical protein SPJ34_06225 [Candidatus Ornithospirochaeta sp.]|nr:hypothetical protein [Candidatus Ornithospirochaeta sp.]
MKGIRAISALLALILLFSCTTIRYESSSAQAEDIIELYGSLRKNHKSFFNSVSRKDAESIVLSELEGAGEKDPAELFMSLSRIASLAHDSHTSVGISSQIVEFSDILPVGIYRFGNEYRVLLTTEENRAILGRSLVAVNGKTLPEIKDALKEYISYDNDVWLDSSFCSFFSFMFFLGKAGIEGESVVLSFDGGYEAEVGIIPYSEYIASEKASIEGSYPYLSNGYYGFCVIGDTLKINYNICAEDPSYPVASFVDDLEKAVNKNGIRRIIVDLRFNGGGNSRVFEPIERFISSSGLECLVLIGRNTFSSAILNASSLRKAGFRTVGEKTGGSLNHYGEVVTGILGNSGIQYSYSTKYFLNDSNAPSGSMVPDLIIEQSYDDYINGIDTVLMELGIE